jgi:hypothetical protein
VTLAFRDFGISGLRLFNQKIPKSEDPEMLPALAARNVKKPRSAPAERCIMRRIVQQRV